MGRTSVRKRKNAYGKDIRRTISRERKRFWSIVAISALGTMMFSGLQAGCQDLRVSADDFFDGQKLHDLEIVSTLGLTDDDISALRSEEGVQEADGIYAETVTVPLEKTTMDAELRTLSKEGIDMPYVVEGSMPAGENEAAVSQKFAQDSGIGVGDSFAIKTQDGGTETGTAAGGARDGGTETGSRIRVTEFTVTAIVTDVTDMDNPFSAVSYRTDETKADVVFITPDAAESGLYTSAVLTAEGAADLFCFSDAYEEKAAALQQDIAAGLKKEREDARTEQVKDEARSRLKEEAEQAAAALSDRQPAADGRELQPGAAAAQRIADSEGAQRIADAEGAQRIADAEAEIDSMSPAKWYLFGRGSMSGYANISSDADSIQSIGTVFPVVFFIVAFLISLTTVTRMVEEDRGLIGTYKSLGFTDREIRRKYTSFAGLACIVGSAAGTLLAFFALPAFLFTVFRIMYLIPEYRFTFVAAWGVPGIAIFLLGIELAAVLACRSQLQTVPAGLMRPKAPPAGSRVLLEKITPIWRRLGFLGKVTARNLFRYRKRMLMTIFGIGGCMALLLFGFSIRDSVADLRPRQYGEIFRYDLMAVSADEDNAKLKAAMEKDLGEEVADCAEIEVQSVKVKTEKSSAAEAAAESATGSAAEVTESGVGGAAAEAAAESATGSAAEVTESGVGGAAAEAAAESVTGSAAGVTESAEVSAQLIVVPAGTDLSPYICLRSRSTGESLTLQDGDVFCTLNASKILGFHAGDRVTLQLPDLSEADVTVSQILDNYLSNYLYMTEKTYEDSFAGSSIEYSPNAFLAHLNLPAGEQASYADSLQSEDFVRTAVSIQKLKDQFGSTFRLMNIIVAIVIVMSAALAFVVLFTLQTTNISEREREMATIKVLGFYNREVHAYLNRETWILTAIGIVIGMPLGRLFAQSLVVILNLPSIYLAVSLCGRSYLYAAALSLTFAFIVTLAGNRTLNRIDPVLLFTRPLEMITSSI